MQKLNKFWVLWQNIWMNLKETEYFSAGCDETLHQYDDLQCFHQHHHGLSRSSSSYPRMSFLHLHILPPLCKKSLLNKGKLTINSYKSKLHNLQREKNLSTIILYLWSTFSCNLWINTYWKTESQVQFNTPINHE